MKKIFYINLNVGSAIEYAGNIFKEWLYQLPNSQVIEYKYQTLPHHTIETMTNIRPDLIVVNEFHPRIISAVASYKLMCPECRILFICHVWRDLVVSHDDCPEFHSYFLNKCDAVFCLNQMPENKANELPFHLYNYYYPTDPHYFRNIIPFNDRTKEFCYIGNLLPHKFDAAFITAIHDYAWNISIDCYGRHFDTLEGYCAAEMELYNEAIDDCWQISHLGELNQYDVGKTFNEYKYFVLPHNGYEPFNFTLLQAVFCGTIPLVLNDRESETYDGTWLDWAKGLYLGTGLLDDYAINLAKIHNLKPDMSDLSILITDRAEKRFNYEIMMNEFKEVAFWVLHGDSK